MKQGHTSLHLCGPALLPALHHHYDARLAPAASSLLQVRRSHRQSPRSLLLHHVSLIKLRGPLSKRRRIFIPFDRKMATQLPQLVLRALTGPLTQEARMQGFEVILFSWQPSDVQHTHARGAVCHYVVGQEVATLVQKKDVLLLLRGAGMQPHLACVLRFAQKKKLLTVTDHERPAITPCNVCYCPSTSSQRQ